MKRIFTNTPSSRSVFVRDISRFFTPRTTTLRGDKRGVKAFTLIELLVVVLIIGILSAVALPQYQKAVMKSRMAQWDVMFDAGLKTIDLYLLANGWLESGRIYLTGTTSVGTLEMPGNCNIYGSYCYTSAGRLEVSCGSSDCNIVISGNFNADATSGNKVFENDNVSFSYTKAGNVYIYEVSGSAGCQWVSTHSDIPVKPAKITACKNTYGVTLPNPQYTN